MTDLAEAPTERPPLPTGLSPSSVASFTKCALAFRFSAIDRLPEESSAAAVKGTLVHLALQRLFRLEPERRTHQQALAELDAALAELADDAEMQSLELTDDERAAMHAEGVELIGRYFQMEDPAQVNPIALEAWVEGYVGDDPDDPEALKLRGIIDRLDVRPDGELVVTDYKTGKAPPERFEAQGLKGMELYAMLVEKLLGKLPVAVQLLYLGDGQVVTAYPKPKVVAKVERRTTAVWTTIKRAHATDGFKPKRGPLCDWCSFQAYCPEFGGDPAEARAEAMRLRVVQEG